MICALKRPLLRLLRVSERPDPPPGSEPTLVAFHASERYFWLMVVGWTLKQAFAFVGIVLSILFLHGLLSFGGMREAYESMSQVQDVRFGNLFSIGLIDLLSLLETFAIVGFVVQLVVTGLLLRLNWEMRWYMVSDESLRLREGLWRVHEQTMTVANIQNMEIRRGPLQRLLGIGDLEVRTAGGGTANPQDPHQRRPSLHVGRFRSVDDPERLRDRIRKALAKHRDAGLGDPDDEQHADEHEHDPHGHSEEAHERQTHEEKMHGAAPPPVGGGVAVAAAANRLLEETRALRRAAEAAYL